MLIRILFVSLIIAQPLISKDLFAKLFENNIATFTDAAEMLYHSFNIVEMSKNTNRSKKYRDETLKRHSTYDPKRIKEYLKSQNIDIDLLSQPIMKKNFAKFIFKRFKSLPQSFLTRNLKFDTLYFQDAQKLHIFSQGDTPGDILTGKQMLDSFLRAFKIAKSP